MSDEVKVRFTYIDGQGYVCNQPGVMDGEYIRVPADDDEPLSEDWLRTLPPFEVWGAADPVILANTAVRIRGQHLANVEIFHDGRVNVNGSTVPCKTRGDLRLLCRALGISLSPRP